MKTSGTNRRLRTVLTGIRSGSLIPNPDFQRRLVWSTKHKNAFLKTVLAGLPFPEIFIAAGDVNTETGEGAELIVDGQQRVTTLYQYFTSSPDLKISGVPTYAELTDDQKTAFLEYEVVVRDLGSLTADETRDLFYRINSTSYSLNAMEVNNARFDGALKSFCDGVSEDDFFSSNNVFTAFDAKRMNDVRWTLTLVITLLSTYFNRDSEHEKYLQMYNDEFPQEAEISSRLNQVFNFVNALSFDAESRVWQKADLLTLLVSVDNAIRERSLQPNDVADRLKRFYALVDSVANGDSSVHDQTAVDYYYTTRSGTNDRSSRIRRAELIAQVLGVPVDVS